MKGIKYKIETVDKSDENLFVFFGGRRFSLFEKVPNTLCFYSPSCHLSFEVIREEGQILLLYFFLVPDCSLYNLDKMKLIREQCTKKYGKKVKIVFVGITMGDLHFFSSVREHFLILKSVCFYLKNIIVSFTVKLKMDLCILIVME